MVTIWLLVTDKPALKPSLNPCLLPPCFLPPLLTLHFYMVVIDALAHWEGVRRLFFKPWSVPPHSVFLDLDPAVQATVKKKWKCNRGNVGAVQRRHGQNTEQAWAAWSQKKGFGVSFDDLMAAVDEHWRTLVSQCSKTEAPTWSSDGFAHDVDAFTPSSGWIMAAFGYLKLIRLPPSFLPTFQAVIIFRSLKWLGSQLRCEKKARESLLFCNLCEYIVEKTIADGGCLGSDVMLKNRCLSS